TLVDQGSRGASQRKVRGLSVTSQKSAEILNNTNGETVATYIGEVPYYLDIRLEDIERVEVLLGPQGTLYGAGTLGGAVRYIPKKPSLDGVTAEINVKTFDVAHSSGVGFDGFGVVNIPLSSTIAIRGLFGYYNDPGFVDYNYLVRTPGVSNPQPNLNDPAAVAANLTSKKDVNDERTVVGRFGVYGQVADNIDATLTWFYQNTKTNGRQITARAALGAGNYVGGSRFLEPNDRENHLVTLELNWDFEWAKLTSATGYATFNERGQRDQTDLLLNFEYGYEAFPSFVAFTREISDERRINQELRLVTNFEGPLNGIIGGFYNHFKLDATSEEFVPGFPAFAGINRPDALEYFQLTTQKLSEKAAFGELTYKIFDWWQVTGGGRYYSYTDNSSTGFDLPLLSGDPTAINPNIQANRITESGFLYKVNTSVNITPEVLIYGTLSEGYRLGGVNPIPPCLTPLPPGQNTCALPNEQLIKPDKTSNKEVGIKGSLFDNRMTFSTAFFYINWTDIQTQSRTVNGGLPITVNGGRAVSKGVEASTSAKLTEELGASVTYSYTDAYLTTLAPGVVGNGVDGLPGDRVAGSPKHQFSLTLDYTRDIGNGYEFGANYGLTYQSNVLSKVGLRDSGEALPGYDLHSASISLSKDAWKVSLYADNIFDQFYVNSVTRDRTFIRDVNGFRLRNFREDIGRPRVIGVSASYKFGS
ncbi:MAG: TonB-dependent receptor, partial [Rhodospirillaceae bacterium]|nr:TonB-dependent receptor [Rhodospirillaceae bacterium]